MSTVGDDPGAVAALLAGAADAIGKTRYCWLTTAAEDGGADPRPMGRLPPAAGEDAWTIRFITDGRSHKVAEMRRDPRVTVIFQHAPDDAFVTLIGTAALRAVGDHWTAAFDAYFPSATDRANAVFVVIDVECVKLWIRGVTPEPFGMRATALEREAGRGWRVVSG